MKEMTALASVSAAADSMPMLKILDKTKRLHIRAPEQIIEDSYKEARD
jgi:hypothetical protein